MPKRRSPDRDVVVEVRLSGVTRVRVAPSRLGRVDGGRAMLWIHEGQCVLLVHDAARDDEASVLAEVELPASALRAALAAMEPR